MGLDTGDQTVANIKYVVELTLDERDALVSKISKGSLAAKANLKARILLKADKGEQGEGWTDRQICRALEASPSTVARTRETFVMAGLEECFNASRVCINQSSRFLMARLKPGSSLWPVLSRLKAMHAGPSACWPKRWLS